MTIIKPAAPLPPAKDPPPDPPVPAAPITYENVCAAVGTIIPSKYPPAPDNKFGPKYVAVPAVPLEPLVLGPPPPPPPTPLTSIHLTLAGVVYVALATLDANVIVASPVPPDFVSVPDAAGAPADEVNNKVAADMVPKTVNV